MGIKNASELRSYFQTGHTDFCWEVFHVSREEEAEARMD